MCSGQEKSCSREPQQSVDAEQLGAVNAAVDLLVELWAGGAPPAQVWGRQYDLGLAWVDFPLGLGGLGLALEVQEHVDDRLRRAGVPANRFENFVGLGMAARTLLAHGSAELQRRLLRPIFTCEEIWCQLFSEPGAGSDLASLATMAVRDGDEWIVNGQKVWTSFGHRARWGLLIARTDPDVPKHRGLTFFVADMSADGIEVRPIRQITGRAEYNEVFLTDVRVPDSARLGEPGDGWRVTLSTLTQERVAVGSMALEGRGNGPIGALTSLWDRMPDRDPAIRDRICRLWIRAEAVRLTMLRAQAAPTRPGPRPEAAVVKLLVSELRPRIYEECVNLLGAHGLLFDSYDTHPPTEDLSLQHAFLDSRQLTIGGGTSEIARNILGERILGLPAEPRVDRDLSWNQTRRGTNRAPR